MADRLLNLGWMRILLEIGRRGSLTAAAQKLGLTQPAVSYQIRRLEEELGIRVLKRHHRGVELTLEGKRLFDMITRHVTEIDMLAADIQTDARPTIRLHTDYAFSSLWLIPRMQDFRKKYPEINIQISATQNPRSEGGREDDILVAFGKRAEAGDDATLLLPEKVRPVCAPGFLDFSPELATPAHFTKLKLIHLESSWASIWHDWPSYFAGAGVSRQAAQSSGDISFNTYSLVIQSAIGGQGLALGWAGLVDDLVESGALVGAGPELLEPDRGYWLAGSTDRKGAAAKFVGWLLEQASPK